MKLEQLASVLQKDSALRRLAVPGQCRVWTAKAMTRIKQTSDEVVAEAREIEAEIGLTHTFIRAVRSNEEPFLYDGTGVGSHPPYFGPEGQAPNHLLGSHPDAMINSYHK